MKNQRLKTLDLWIMFSLIGFTLTVAGSLLTAETKNPELIKSLLGAENLALQLSSGGLGSLNTDEVNSLRNPASIENSSGFNKSLELFGKHGKIGMDPWGNAFRYIFIESSNNNLKKPHIVVWSDGPDGTRDTSQEDIENLDVTLVGTGELHLRGDDIGYVRKLEIH